MKVLVAGMGNDLCRDDGFGIETVRRLATVPLPEGVRVIESGIGGIALVQELMDGYDRLVIVDAADRGGSPGTVYVLQMDVPYVDDLSAAARAEFTADMHYTVPSKALLLARALGVLPPLVYLLGCQPAEQGLGIGLSGQVEKGVTKAVEELGRLFTHKSLIPSCHDPQPYCDERPLTDPASLDF
ncbi:MAG: hydrogenase maturation protease [Chloroflexota bacterium]|nr:MAG: hypothetical protein DLM70_11050 [Chloroflexota bacterium]